MHKYKECIIVKRKIQKFSPEGPCKNV